MTIKNFWNRVMTFFVSIENRLFDFVNKTDTRRRLLKEDFPEKPKNFEHGHIYGCSCTSIVRKSTKKSLEALSLGPGDVTFIDLGCGKGKVLCCWINMFSSSANSSDFIRFVGVEYSEYLLETCRKNLEKISASSRGSIELICSCVTDFDFEFQSTALIVYLYNSFDRTIVNEVGKILQKKRAILIYCNPTCEDVFLNQGFRRFYKEKRLTFGGGYVLLSSPNFS